MEADFDTFDEMTPAQMADLPIIRPGDPLLLEDTSVAPSAKSIVPCLMCAKPFRMPIYMGEPDQVCHECAHTYDECARLVCSKCRNTLGRIEPQTLDNGFVIRPRVVLHSTTCNTCTPNVRRTDIMEIRDWERTQRGNVLYVPVRFAEEKPKK